MMLRRNGVASSCEPCRKSKIKCDHGQPVCQRCQRRGRSAQCYYHPAPLSRSADGERPPEQVKRQRLSTTGSSISSSPSTPIRPAPEPATSRNWAVGNSRVRLSTTDSFGLKCQPLDFSILKLLRPFSLYENLIAGYFEFSQSAAVPTPFVLPVLQYVRTELENIVEDEDYERLFDRISANTAKSFEVNASVKAEEFYKLYTGENLRWEFVGLIFVLAGISTLVLSPTHPAFILTMSTHLDSNKFVIDMISASNSCISLCRQCGSENEVMLWLLLCNALLISNHYGDTSQALWRRLGDLISDVFSMGLHRNPDPSVNRPFFLNEIHKRLFAALYRADKSLATFLGRPPRVPRHYCDLRMPLDLPDDSLILEGRDLENALATLDANGWNKDRNIRKSSFIRMRYELSSLREEVLELTSCHFTDDIRRQLTRILDDLPQKWAEVPDYLRYDDGCWAKFPDSNACLALLSCYLDYLHSGFLVQRHLARQSQTTRPDLIKTSMHILTTVMAVITKQNFIADEHHLIRDFPWFLCFYGLPSAGVLATELRHCTLACTPMDPAISRSRLIRNLSVLITALGWIDRPNHRYYKLCREAHDVLSTILDEALNFQPSKPPTAVSTSNGISTDIVGGNGEETVSLGPVGTLSTHQPQEQQQQQQQQFSLNANPAMDASWQMDSENFLAWLDSVDWNSTVPTF